MSTTAYFDCFSGVSGDMILGALVDAGLDADRLGAALESLPLKGFRLEARAVKRGHLAGTQVEVVDEGGQPLRHLKDLNAIVDGSGLDAKVKESARAIFESIAVAEARVHGTPLEHVHFHEIGAVDTVVDVVGALEGLRLLGVERVVCSPLNVGTGMVEFSHGRWPVPAPATAELLKGKPTYATDSQAELVTPTGAAIVAHVAAAFGPPPLMAVERIGYGAGSRELAVPNMLRVTIGRAADADGLDRDVVAVLETNIDDMNPQLYQWVMERLLDAGALDVSVTPTGMKKGRPGALLTVLAECGREAALAETMLIETTSLGVRTRFETRYKLSRSIETVETEFGPLRVKAAIRDGRVLRRTPEYDDCRRIAEERGLPLIEVYRRVEGALTVKGS